MSRLTGFAAFAGAALFAFSAAAVPTSNPNVDATLLATSTNGGGNTAGITYAQGFGANLPAGASWSDDPTVTPPPGNVSGQYQSPFNNTVLQDVQNYYNVGGVSGANGAPSPQTLSFDSDQSAFTLLWGSIDSYNTLEFLDGAGSVLSLTGTELVSLFMLGGTPTNFEQVALVTFDFLNGITFDNVKFSSSQAAFEFALAPVPLPAAAWLMIAALAGLGFVGRRRPAA